MSHQLGPGQRLAFGESLSSPNGEYLLRMQEDGNLVVYAPGNRAIWHSKTYGQSECVAVMQEDGNFVVYAKGNQPVWDSDTDGQPNCIVKLQDDGNLVVYAAGNRAVWASGSDKGMQFKDEDRSGSCSCCAELTIRRREISLCNVTKMRGMAGTGTGIARYYAYDKDGSELYSKQIKLHVGAKVPGGESSQSQFEREDFLRKTSVGVW